MAMYTRSDGRKVSGERRREISADDVLGTFAPYQPKTARMVANEAGIDPETAEALLSELEVRGDLTIARGGTDMPVWLRPPQRRSGP